MCFPKRYLNMIYRIWGDRLVVCSWLLCGLSECGFRWSRLSELERYVLLAAAAFLATRATAMSQLRSFLFMLAFDSLYHTRAWLMLFCNVLQLLFSRLGENVIDC